MLLPNLLLFEARSAMAEEGEEGDALGAWLHLSHPLLLSIARGEPMEAAAKGLPAQEEAAAAASVVGSTDGPVDPAEARRRRRDIREGKRPIQEILCNKSASLAFSVSPSSSIVPQGDCSTPLSSCFSPLSLRQPTDPSLTSGPSFINGFRPIMSAEPTPLVFPLPYVHPMQAGLNRMKRKFLWRHRSGKTKATVRGRSYYGGPEYICGAWHALYWFQERSKGAHNGRFSLPVYNGCCCGGKVSLPKFPDWPFPLKDLVRFDGDDASSRFLKLIRHYNSMFCFTSLGAHVDESVNMGSGPYVFKMGGSVYHRIGSLMSVDNEAPKFAQLYIVDSADELNCRLDVFEEQGGAPSQADPFVVLSLTEMLDEHNPYVQLYRTARQRLRSADAPDLAIQFFGHEGAAHGDRYSGPTVPEVAALIVGELTPECHKFDVIAEAASGELEHISYLNPSLMPLQYPLLFPYGDPSFHVGIEYQQRQAAGRRRRRQNSRQTSSSSSRKCVTMLQYYAYYFHYRRNEPNPYTCCGRLSQQAAVNCYSCVEASRLSYHFLKQDELRSETYQGITDAMGEGNTIGKNLGVQIMLHSSFTGGRRYFVQNYHDGMAICREFQPMFQCKSFIPPGEPIGRNEILEFIQCRYLCACEAFWRMFAFDIHGREPSVERLVVHLPGMNRVIFHENAKLDKVIRNPNAHRTMLTKRFVTNQENEDARHLTYLDFPSQWVWDNSDRMWSRRRRNQRLGGRIGRIYHVHPATGELFFLRMLLMVVIGATCFEDLKCYNGIVYGTFKEACQARGLVGDDNEWFKLFEEAIVWATPFQLRHLFMTVLLHCEVTNADALFDRYWPSMVEDISHRLSLAFGNTAYDVPEHQLRNQLLDEMSSMFSKNGSSLAAFNITSRAVPLNKECVNKFFAEEMMYDKAVLLVESQAMQAQLNNDQIAIYNEIVQAINAHAGGVYFVSGDGRTGKTFLWNTIIKSLRSDSRVVLAVASSGVASLLLPGGRTGHSRFKIPIQTDHDTMCSISRGSHHATLIEKADLVLWDEAPMVHRHCFEAVDRTFRDILSANDPAKASLPFGGKVVVLGGDFRQILPIVEGGTKNDIIGASLIMSPLWRHVKVLKLTINMRLFQPSLSSQSRTELSEFADWVQDIGNGRLSAAPTPTDNSTSLINIPDDMLLPASSDSISSVVDSVYDSFFFNYSDPAYLAQRAILCPTNAVVNDINDAVFARVPGNSKSFFSYDAISKTTDHVGDADLLFPPELLHSITIINFPEHEIVLKV